MRTLIADPALIEATLASLHPCVTAGDSWVREYVDPVQGTVWHLTYLLGYLQGGGYQCLVRMPVPTCTDLVELIRMSAARDEVWAAAVLLHEDPECYPELLKVLEQAARVGDWSRVRCALESSGIASGMNRRAIVGQTVAEISRDAAHFAALAERSRVLAAKVHAALGHDARSLADRVNAPWGTS